MKENQKTVVVFEIDAKGIPLEKINSMIKKICEAHEEKCELHIKITI